MDKRLKQKAAAMKRHKATAKGIATQKKHYRSDAKKASNRRWRERPENRAKILAQRAVNYAIKLGKIARMPCEVCGKPNAFAHHDDYSRQLSVRWLCNNHHTEHHRK